MRQWLQQILPLLIMIFVVAGPAIGRIAQAIAEKKRRARMQGGPRGTGSGETALDRKLRERKQRTQMTRQERAAQRQAQVDEWRQRQDAYRSRSQQAGPTKSAPSGTPGDAPADARTEIARRRQQAIEALRRRQAQARQTGPAGPARGATPGPTGPGRPQAGPQGTPIPRGRAPQSAPARQVRPPAPAGGPKPRVQPPPRQVPKDTTTAARRPQGVGLEAAVRPRISRRAPGPILPIGRTGLRLSRKTLRQAFVLKEILDAPIALRESHRV